MQQERCLRPSDRRRPFALGQQRAVRDSDGRHTKHRTEMQRETGATGMVTAGGIDEQNVERRAELAERTLEHGTLAEGEQAG
jgi:hypothetical protein